MEKKLKRFQALLVVFQLQVINSTKLLGGVIPATHCLDLLCIMKKSEAVPPWVICKEPLSNHAVRPSLLQHHLNAKHSSFKRQTIIFLRRKLSELKDSKKPQNALTSINVKALEVSHHVRLTVAQTGKPQTIGEAHGLPAAKDIVVLILWDKDANQLGVISLSNNKVSRRILDMVSQGKEKLIESAE